jgi:hypothetical protein
MPGGVGYNKLADDPSFSQFIDKVMANDGVTPEQAGAVPYINVNGMRLPLLDPTNANQHRNLGIPMPPPPPPPPTDGNRLVTNPDIVDDLIRVITGG